MLRVGFVLRSTEIQPECFRFVSPTVCLCGVGVVKVFKGPRGSKAFGSPHGRLLRDPPTASAGERVARGRSRVGAPKCVGTAASGPVPNLRIFFGFSGFRNSAPGCAGQPCQWVGRMGEWPGSQWRAGWTEGALGPAGPLRLREPGPAPCLPDSIDVCLAVWEQFWCDRAGLFCGSLAFPRVRRRLVRRGPSRGKTYAYPEGHPQWLRRRSA